MINHGPLKARRQMRLPGSGACCPLLANVPHGLAFQSGEGEAAADSDVERSVGGATREDARGRRQPYDNPTSENKEKGLETPDLRSRVSGS